MSNNSIPPKDIQRNNKGQFLKTGKKKCQLEDCESFTYGHKMCSKHYQRMKAHGDPYYEVPRLTEEERIAKKKENNLRYSRSKKGKNKRKLYGQTENGQRHRKLVLERRRSKIKTATPDWVNKKALREIYKNVPDDKVVDHIFPLTLINEIGEEIGCGLHVPWNLQYLSFDYNGKKSNKIEHLPTDFQYIFYTPVEDVNEI